jgi:hypothetical protein
VVHHHALRFLQELAYLNGIREQLLARARQKYAPRVPVEECHP